MRPDSCSVEETFDLITGHDSRMPGVSARQMCTERIRTFLVAALTAFFTAHAVPSDGDNGALEREGNGQRASCHEL